MLFGGHHLTPPPTRQSFPQPSGPGGPPPLLRFRLPSCRYAPPEVPPPEPPQPPQPPPLNFNPYIAACIHTPPAWLPPPPHTYTSAPMGE